MCFMVTGGPLLLTRQLTLWMCLVADGVSNLSMQALGGRIEQRSAHF